MGPVLGEWWQQACSAARYAVSVLPFGERAELQKLNVVKKLGCGHEGCVYTTRQGTVVKVSRWSDIPATSWGESLARAELTAAQVLQRMAGRNSIVPTIYAAGKMYDLFEHGWPGIYIEREGLNDLQLSDEGEAQFTDDVGRILSNASQKQVAIIPSFVPAEDRKKLKALVRGYLWLKAHGIEPEDHNGSENWGVRADGSIALRDLGHVYVSDVLREEIKS